MWRARKKSVYVLLPISSLYVRGKFSRYAVHIHTHTELNWTQSGECVRKSSSSSSNSIQSVAPCPKQNVEIFWLAHFTFGFDCVHTTCCTTKYTHLSFIVIFSCIRYIKRFGCVCVGRVDEFRKKAQTDRTIDWNLCKLQYSCGESAIVCKCSLQSTQFTINSNVNRFRKNI